MKSNAAIPCPDCKTPIPMDMQGMMNGESFTCPACGLKVALSSDTDKGYAKGALDALSKLKGLHG